MKPVKGAWAVSIIVMAATTAACTSGVQLPERLPDVSGVITQVDSTAGQGLPRLLIEENPADSSGTMKAWASIVEDTQLYRRQGEGLANANLDDFQQGSRVTAWFSGPVLQSYPAQGGAEVMVLEE
jgi:hypothetical protein